MQGKTGQERGNSDMCSNWMVCLYIGDKKDLKWSVIHVLLWAPGKGLGRIVEVLF